MSSTTFFSNILLSDNFLIGRAHAPKRKKGDWRHSIGIFTSMSILRLKKDEDIKCIILHFFGCKGGPVLEKTSSTIKYKKTHIGKRIYSLSYYEGSIGVMGEIRTVNGYEPSNGKSSLSCNQIIRMAKNKWGYEKIPYTHQKKESYNCVGFTDDILYMVKYGEWNPRIVANHIMYGLYV